MERFPAPGPSPEEGEKEKKPTRPQIQKAKDSLFTDLTFRSLDRRREIEGRIDPSDKLPSEKEKTAVLPPVSGKREQFEFYIKREWDDFVQPILDFEGMCEQIQEQDISNTKKKEQIRELEALRDAVENRLCDLPDWKSDASVEEKRKYLKRLEKSLFQRLPRL